MRTTNSFYYDMEIALNEYRYVNDTFDDIAVIRYFDWIIKD